MMEQRNLMVAVVLSLAILLGFQFLYERPREQARQAALQAQQSTQPLSSPSSAVPATGAPPAAATTAPTTSTALPQSPAVSTAAPLRAREAVLQDAPRVAIRSQRVSGSISLVGARIDDITLERYRETIDPTSPHITLLNPSGTTSDAYFAEQGWVAEGGGVDVPGRDTRWSADRETLTPDQPVTFAWTSPQGLRFERRFAIDQNYMITVTQRVTNGGSTPVTLFPYGVIARIGKPQTLGFFILHEGFVGVANDTLKEVKFGKADPGTTESAETKGGWFGLTDKYWLVSLIPNQAETVKQNFRYTVENGIDHYQVDFLGAGQRAEPGATIEEESRLFAGAKEVRLLREYRDTLNIPRFDYAVDWGWFFFLTRPIFTAMDWIYHQVGNFGIAILILTIAIKALFYPLATRSYIAMGKMKKLAPKLTEMKEKFGDDRQKLNQEMMALYREEKVNPLAGCLPILLQIPVFFSLYKVLFVTIEMRHAPFFGWIQDLSAPDPTTIFNLFGLIAWTPPHFLHLGAWPLIMGVTMFLQQRLNPAPPDPIQAKIFMFMPVVFTIMLGSFPAGLVIYWAWNNTLSIAQQWTIMRRQGAV